MADFHQGGHVATLHNLRVNQPDALVRELEAFTATRKITLILPSLFSELEGEALPDIIDELNKVDFIHRIVIGLDRATEEQYRYALKFFSKLKADHVVLCRAKGAMCGSVWAIQLPKPTALSWLFTTVMC